MGLFKRSMFLGMAAIAILDGFAQAENTLRGAFADKFLIGTALNVRQVESKDKALQALVRNQFSAVVAENCMKAEVVQPKEGVFKFEDGDRLCDIYKVVGHYKGRVKGWDVVNEAIEGNGEFRKSPFYKIIGPDFIRLAFQFAHEADPDVELYYNDYGMDSPRKREAVVRLVKDLKAHGCRIDAVGMQSHLGLNTSLGEYEKSMEAFIGAGVKVLVTEMELSVLPWPKGNYGAAIETNFAYKDEMDPYKDGLPEEKAKEQNDFYIKLFDIYLRHSKDIGRVTFWGVSDGDSWKNNFPIHGRTDYPLAFDRDLKPKPFVKTVIEMAKSGRYDK